MNKNKNKVVTKVETTPIAETETKVKGTLVRATISSNDPTLNQAKNYTFTLGNDYGIQTYTIFFGIETILPISVLEFLKEQVHTTFVGNLDMDKEDTRNSSANFSNAKFNIVEHEPMTQQQANKWLADIKKSNNS